ncbi:hypothetical protein NDU88_011638, partial [Pleurodeles waltl]
AGGVSPEQRQTAITASPEQKTYSWNCQHRTRDRLWLSAQNKKHSCDCQPRTRD